MSKQNVAAYSLLEGLIVVFLLSILLSLGSFGYRKLLAHDKTTAYLTSIATALNFARSAAIAQHLPVTLCRSKDGLSCNGAWRDGWISFIDAGNTRQPISAAQILQVQHGLPEGDTLSWHASLQKNDYVQFNGLGNVRQAGSFIYCPARQPQAAGMVIISLTGRIRIVTENIAHTNCN